jgi:hypothetical protein
MLVTIGGLVAGCAGVGSPVETSVTPPAVPIGVADGFHYTISTGGEPTSFKDYGTVWGRRWLGTAGQVGSAGPRTSSASTIV